MPFVTIPSLFFGITIKINFLFSNLFWIFFILSKIHQTTLTLMTKSMYQGPNYLIILFNKKFQKSFHTKLLSQMDLLLMIKIGYILHKIGVYKSLQIMKKFSSIHPQKQNYLLIIYYI